MKGIIKLVIPMLMASVSAAQAEDWTFSAVPYLWLSSVSGDVATIPGAPPSHIDMSFSDIFHHLDMAFMLAGEARNDRLSFWGDLMYVGMSAEGDVNHFDMDYENDLWVVSAGGAYSLFKSDNSLLDLALGARYWNLDNTLEFSVDIPPYPARKVSATQDWFDPMFGLKGRYEIDPHWFVNGWAFTSAGAGSSDSSYDLYAGLGYVCGNKIISLGYRYLAVDYNNDGFLYDVKQYGPMLGFGFRF